MNFENKIIMKEVTNILTLLAFPASVLLAEGPNVFH